MAKHGALLFSYVLSVLILTMGSLCNAIDHEDRKLYVVYLGSLPDDDTFSPLSHQIGILERVAESTNASNFLIRSYKRSFNGFAAKLTDKERERLANMKEVVSVFPNEVFQLHTTRSWDFIGFRETIERKPTVESDVIVGVIDGGIWPESESFKDDAFGPPPKKWKGACEGGTNFTCNNKIIGARSYNTSSARDEFGHGTHTASIVAGNAVKGASFYGLAQGTARGGVPSARIAVYKVCLLGFCLLHNVLAAFDDAIADGVDIITVSIGAFIATDFDKDPIAIGAFHALRKGILTTNSAGNSGPVNGSIASVAPWILTVAASSTDRRFIDKVNLGNGKTLIGNSVNYFDPNVTSYPLIHGKDASSKKCPEDVAGKCQIGCLESKLVKGKIVLCDDIKGEVEARQVGAEGAILSTSINDVSFIFPLPAIGLNSTDYDVVKSYLNSSEDARAKILPSETIRDPAAPVVASFSSRGPNKILPEIIKPDISAPGVNILGAYSPIGPISDSILDKRHVNYSIISGTSIACPHVAGVAAYIRTFHPDWSPAAIKSSLMTTAGWPIKYTGDSPGEYAYGSGQISPLKAVDPGLVYEASEDDYIKLLCSIYDEARVKLISGGKSPCPKGSKQGSPKDFNYPSLAAIVTPGAPFSVPFNRTVKNVGLANSTYTAKILPTSTVDIKVVPEVLSFKSLNEEKTFTVTVVGRSLKDGSYVSASLVWSDGTHTVRSPILVSTKPASS